MWHNPPVNPKKEAQEILSEKRPPRRKRAPHGQWVAPARTVLILTDEGWNVSDAIREVIDRHKFITAKEGTDEHKRQFRQAFDGIRASYYIANAKRKAKPKKGEFRL